MLVGGKSHSHSCACWQVHFLAENVKNMADHTKKYIDTRFQAHDPLAAPAIAFNSKHLTPVSRNRLYGTNLPGAREGLAKIEHQPKQGQKTLGHYLDPGRTTKKRVSDCILTKGQKGKPVRDSAKNCMTCLNPAEVERVMAVEGYTDGSGLTKKTRLQLLGSSWHLQTIVELLRDLATPG